MTRTNQFLGLIMGGMIAISPVLSVFGSEQLRLLPPTGWNVASHEVKNQNDMTKIIPSSELLQNWKNSIIVQVFSSPSTRTDPQDILSSYLESLIRECEGLTTGRLELAQENGYDTGLRAVACPKSNQSHYGALSLIKVIMGSEKTYLISRSWRGPDYEGKKIQFPAEKLGEWMLFMKKIYVCNPEDKRHPCEP
jgi:hypothetical protein